MSDYTELISNANKAHAKLLLTTEVPQILEFAGVLSIGLVNFSLILHELILYTIHLDFVSFY
jgi:hypothetical protein